jgi:hypothetical protein
MDQCQRRRKMRRDLHWFQLVMAIWLRAWGWKKFKWENWYVRLLHSWVIQRSDNLTTAPSSAPRPTFEFHIIPRDIRLSIHRRGLLKFRKRSIKIKIRLVN